MQAIKRSNEVDVIRMMALLGICVVNIHFMALPVEEVFAKPASAADKMAAFLVECLFQLKFFLLFSFIFGWGMAIQQRSSQAQKRLTDPAPELPNQPPSFARRYFRRMAGLALLGAAHAILVFSGDILLLYALLGCLLWLIKDFTVPRLLQVAGWMVPLSMLCLTLLAVLFADMANPKLPLPGVIGSEASGLGGSFIAATQLRIADWPATLGILLLLQGPLAFAAFAAGLAAAKTDFFAHGSSGYRWLGKRCPLLLAIALPLNAWYAAVMGGLIAPSNEWLSLGGLVLAAVAAPALSLVYLWLFIWVARVITVPQLLVWAGKNTLSCYVLQGVIAGWVFGGYGLGLFGHFGQWMLLWLALGIALVSMLLVGLYAGKFSRGPLEQLLRRMSGYF
ncbi:DUF418 domain-containing protein [Rheinheimera riviphila]|nr:DUF418 domain-containing protein [Rheinheimera riviphila]